MIYTLALLLVFVGIYGVLVARTTLKIVLGLMLVEHGIHLLIILIGYRSGGLPPIMTPGISPASFANGAVDPLPQALVLTSIVIGLGVLALMVALCVRLYERYGTFDLGAMRGFRRQGP